MNLDKRLLEFIHPTRLAFYFTILIGFIVGVCIVLQARTESSIVNQVFQHGGELNDVAISVLILLILIILRAGLVWSGELSANRVATNVKIDLRKRLFNHIQTIGPAKISAQQEISTGELTNLITECVESLDSYLRQYLTQLA